MGKQVKDKELKKGRRITLSNRIDIQGYLQKGMAVDEIAKRLGKNHSSIVREIARHATEKIGSGKRECPLLKRKYLVCNQCPKKDHCAMDKRYYNCTEADCQARKSSHDAHFGPRLRMSELLMIDSAVSEGVGRGQSIEHICHASPEKFRNASPAKIRRLIRGGLMAVKPGHLRRVRRLRKYVYKRPDDPINMRNVGDKAGRGMDAFRAFMLAHPDSVVAQLDSVEGKIADRHSLLTILIVGCRFQTGTLYLRDSSGESAKAAIKAFCDRMLKKTKGFLVLLSDNGVEFSLLASLEGEHVKVFFTKPYCATDKAECERNHELLRYISPKGVSLDDLCQDDASWMFSNIDSYLRESLEWKSPYDKVEALFPGLAHELGIRHINPSEVDFGSRRRPSVK